MSEDREHFKAPTLLCDEECKAFEFNQNYYVSQVDKPIVVEEGLPPRPRPPLNGYGFASFSVLSIVK